MAKKKSQQIEHAEIVQRFASRLREVRSSRGLTQAELARAAQVTASYIWRLESAGAAPGIDLVSRLAFSNQLTVCEEMSHLTAAPTLAVAQHSETFCIEHLGDGMGSVASKILTENLSDGCCLLFHQYISLSIV